MKYSNDEKQTILYYPSIKIEDGAWLRNAILYWDKVASIVPGINYNEKNSIEIEYLWDEGIYEPIYPYELQENEHLCNEFCDQVKRKLTRNRKANCGRKTDYTRVHREKLQIVNTHRVHLNKTPERIMDFLLEEEIVRVDCEGPWMNMNSREAELYMAMLAKYLSMKRENTEIGTDKSKKFYDPYVRSQVKMCDYEKQIYMSFALQEILPVPVGNIPIEKIIDFKKQHAKELKCFKIKIDEYQMELARCKNTDEIYQCTQMFRRGINENMLEIEEYIASKNMKWICKSITSIIPVLGTAALDFLELNGVITPGEKILADLGWGFSVNFFGNREDTQLEKSTAYLFHARKNGIIHPVRK